MKDARFRCLCLIMFMSICGIAGAQQKANYQLGEKFRLLTQNPISKYSTSIHPTFINDTDCFYYSFTTSDGKKYYYVNPQKKEKRLLFDTPELLSKIAVYTGKSYSPANVYLSFTFESDNETMRFDFDREFYTYNMRTKKVKKLGEKSSYAKSDPYWMKYSPDSLFFLYAERHNLYFVGNGKKGQDTIPIQLTTDGVTNYTFNREDEGESGGRCGAESAHWIPGTHRFYAVREDNRKVRDLWLINSLSTPSPELKTYKAELAGDKHVTQYELLIGDVDTREVKKIDINRWPDQYVDVVYCSNDGKRLYLQRYKRTWDEADICMVNVETGEVKSLIHEKNKPYLDYQMRSITFLNDGNEILFRSERSGWGHYYLYDKDGNLKNQVTSGAWVASPLLQVDTVRRQIYFYGYGRKEGVDPYYYILYRADLDKENELTCLTPENATHNITLSPSCDYYVDGYSRVDMEPKNVVRNRKGKIIMTLEDPDLDRLYEMGWRAPERFSVKAADGVTDLYGVMWKPADFDSTKLYPIISCVYPGPFFEYVPTRFTINDELNTRLAQLGFIVITVGHRGCSPMRGKYYHTFGYGNQRDYPLADDKYVIEQLADRYSFIDRKKVGIYGHSGGGFMAAAAICTYPDFYSAAVASAGNHDNNMYNKGWVEIHYGVRESKKMVKDSLGNEHEEITYFTSSKTNMDLAKNYKSGLLLVTGDMDNTVHPAHTMKMADALIKAGKYFDMLVLPGNRHGYGGMAEYFYEQKLWHHFARFLLEDSSADYQTDLDYFMKK